MAKKELVDEEVSISGHRILKMANKVGKGWFAILLSEKIDFHTVVPSYILDAVVFAHPHIKDRVWASIFRYRYRSLKVQELHAEADLRSLLTTIRNFEAGNVDFDFMKAQMLKLFPDDLLNDFTERY